MKASKDEQVGIGEPELRIQRPTEDKNNPFYTKEELESIELNTKYKVYTRKELVKLVDEVNEGLLKGMEEYDMKNKKELCGKVYCPELNYCGYPKILERNIFDLNGPMNASLYELRNYTDKKEFETQLAKEIRYELGSRSEYECYLDTAFNKDESKILKIDPYKQVEMNGEQFVNYCGENRKLFGGERFKKANRRLKELRKYGRSLK